MKKVISKHFVDYLDSLLRSAEIQDVSMNGLQVEGPESIFKVAFAVDASLASFKKAIEAKAQLLVVHHGLFWGRPIALVGPHYRRIKALMDAGLGLYASHLPLDCNPKIGHNAEMARMLGLRNRWPFGQYHGTPLGIAGILPKVVEFNALVSKVAKILGSPVGVLPHGPTFVSRIGCVSGQAADMLDQAAENGLDAFVTGEASHRAFHESSETNLNVIFGGHYATETLGLKALEQHVAQKFGLQTTFLDVPTNL